MPKVFPLSLLENPLAHEFYLQKQITDVDCVRYHLRDSICLGIDTEGREGIREGITSVGIAVLPPMDCVARTFHDASFDIQKLVDHYGIESSCLYVEGRKRRKPHPSFSFGLSCTTTRPGEEIRAIVDKVKQHYPGRDIILVGWHPQTLDLSAIQALIPDLFHEVAGWVDVIDIMQQICVSKQEDLLRTWPSLTDVMLCVGFGRDCLPELRFAHCAGTDAIHTIPLLARLLTYESGDCSVGIWRQRPLKQWRHQEEKEQRRQQRQQQGRD